MGYQLNCEIHAHIDRHNRKLFTFFILSIDTNEIRFDSVDSFQCLTTNSVSI